MARLHAPTAPSVQRVVKDAEDKDADVRTRLHANQHARLNLAPQFLALRLLNKRSRVKLSPDSLKLDSLPGKGVLFATANSIGYFAAATCTATNEHSEYEHLLTTAQDLTSPSHRHRTFNTDRASKRVFFVGLR